MTRKTLKLSIIFVSIKLCKIESACAFDFTSRRVRVLLFEFTYAKKLRIRQTLGILRNVSNVRCVLVYPIYVYILWQNNFFSSFYVPSTLYSYPIPIYRYDTVLVHPKKVRHSTSECTRKAYIRECTQLVLREFGRTNQQNEEERGKGRILENRLLYDVHKLNHLYTLCT